MVEIPPTVLSWSRGLASLSPGVVPCRGLRPDEWAETHRRCQEFVERWGMQAHYARAEAETGWKMEAKPFRTMLEPGEQAPDAKNPPRR